MQYICTVKLVLVKTLLESGFNRFGKSVWFEDFYLIPECQQLRLKFKVQSY